MFQLPVQQFEFWWFSSVWVSVAELLVLMEAEIGPAHLCWDRLSRTGGVLLDLAARPAIDRFWSDTVVELLLHGCRPGSGPVSS